jgi:hypothetical protein
MGGFLGRYSLRFFFVKMGAGPVFVVTVLLLVPNSYVRLKLKSVNTLISETRRRRI